MIDPASYRFLADRIVERTQEHLPATAVLHGDARQPVGSALIDSTFDLLRMNTQDMHGDTNKPRNDRFGSAPEHEAYDHMFETVSERWNTGTANTSWNTPGSGKVEEDGKAATSGFTNDLGQMLLSRAEPTKPLRLTIHTLALSLCLYVPALGAAMFAYTMLRDVFPMAAQAV